MGRQLAAVIVEPVQSRHPSLQPAEFVRRLRTITQRHGIVLMFDEMLTGFRPASRAAPRRTTASPPDLATYGKALGGGFPIGAIAGRADIMDGVDGGYLAVRRRQLPAARHDLLRRHLHPAPGLRWSPPGRTQPSEGAAAPASRKRSTRAPTRSRTGSTGSSTTRNSRCGSTTSGRCSGSSTAADMELLYHHLLLQGRVRLGVAQLLPVHRAHRRRPGARRRRRHRITARTAGRRLPAPHRCSRPRAHGCSRAPDPGADPRTGAASGRRRPPGAYRAAGAGRTAGRGRPGRRPYRLQRVLLRRLSPGHPRGGALRPGLRHGQIRRPARVPHAVDAGAALPLLRRHLAQPRRAGRRAGPRDGADQAERGLRRPAAARPGPGRGGVGDGRQRCPAAGSGIGCATGLAAGRLRLLPRPFRPPP